MTVLVLLAVLVAIALAAPRYGVDSRWGPVRPRHTVTADVLALVARLRGVTTRARMPR